MDFWERASSRMVKATIFSRILLRNYNLFAGKAGFPNLPALTYTDTDTDTASGEERGMIVFKVFGGRGTVGVRGMTVSAS